MTKHRAVVTGWDPAKVNPDGSTGRPKGVQTAIDHRIATTYDVLAEGIFAKAGVPAITGSPTNSASISPFQAAIASPNGGFYIVSIDAAENFTINLANVGAVKIYVQQQDYEVDSTKVDSNVVIGVVYGATAIPAGSLLLFTTTITAQTSTNGLTFTPAFKYTGAASGQIRVPTQADLANVAVIAAGIRALVTTSGGGGTAGEYFYNGSAWQITTVGNAALDSLLATGWIPLTDTWTYNSWNSTYKIGVINVPSNATLKFSKGMRIRISQTTGGTKHGIIVDLTATTLTIYFGNLYTLTNETISSPNWSGIKQPFGWPSDPDNWSIESTNGVLQAQQNPVKNTWYNIAGLGLNIPIGAWRVSYQVGLQVSCNVSGYIITEAALSTSTTAATNARLGAGAGANSTESIDELSVSEVPLNLTANTPHYLLSRANGNTSATPLWLYNLNDRSNLRIRAVSAYL